MKKAFLLLLATPAAVLTYQPSFKKPATTFKHAKAAATAALTTLLLAEPCFASSSTAAQVSLNALPPSSISVQIGDLPVVGKLLSGTYTKVPDGSIKTKPSVTIQSPKDKVNAIKEIATSGHLEFDVSGILNTHLDVDVAADESGVAKVRIASNLIPKLPYKNLASSSQTSPTGGKESPWNMVTNMGSGETYYYNEKTGVTQYQKPDKI